MVKVSIIIPAHNCAEFIDETLNSVLQQTYSSFEIIIVDDGSTDNTKEKLQFYINQYPQKIKYYWQENGGTAKARNKALSYAQGEYIAFLDGDDVFFPEKLEKTVKFLEDNLIYAMVYSDMVLIDENGHFLKNWLESKRHFSQGDIYINLLHECFFIPTSLVIRKKIVDEVGGFVEEIINAEDIDWFLRIARKYKVGLIKEQLVKWRIHSDNRSKDIKSATRGIIKVFEEQLSSCDISQEARKLLRKRLARKYSEIGQDQLFEQQQSDASNSFWRSIVYRFSVKSLIFYLLSILPFSFGQKLYRLKLSRIQP